MILCLAAAVFLLGNPKRETGFAVSENHELQSSETKELLDSETIESDESEEQASEQAVTFENNETMEGVTGHELIAQDKPDDSSDDKWDSYGFFGIESGQYALSNTACEIKEGENRFNYVISWDPTGNYIRVGLISEDKSDMYYVTCVGGEAKSVIDISQIPAGNYYVIVYNETSSNLTLNGAITYKFTNN